MIRPGIAVVQAVRGIRDVSGFVRILALQSKMISITSYTDTFSSYLRAIRQCPAPKASLHGGAMVTAPAIANFEVCSPREAVCASVRKPFDIQGTYQRSLYRKYNFTSLDVIVCKQAIACNNGDRNVWSHLERV